MLPPSARRDYFVLSSAAQQTRDVDDIRYVDSTFIGRGRYHRAICGDNSEMESTIRAVLRPLGEADIIIPYYVEVRDKQLFRHVVSSNYTFLVNLLGGNSLRYYNGLPVHRRYN